jgi:hypothetical protein
MNSADQLQEFSPHEPSPPAAGAGAAVSPAGAVASPAGASAPVVGSAAAPSSAAGGSDELLLQPTPIPARPAAVAITSSLFFNPVFMSYFPPDESFAMSSNNFVWHSVSYLKLSFGTA